MDWDVRFTDIAIICATVLGPNLAVQAQKLLERRREVRRFQSVVRNKDSILSPASRQMAKN